MFSDGQRAIVVPGGAAMIADSLIHDGHRIQALHQLERGPTLLVQRQRLQLETECLVEASVGAIDAADAVVDSAELDEIWRAKQE